MGVAEWPSDEIKIRISIVNALIRKLDGDPDLRTPQAIAELERQRGVLEDELKRRQVDATTPVTVHIPAPPDGGKPPPVVVGLKPLRLRSSNTGG